MLGEHALKIERLYLLLSQYRLIIFDVGHVGLQKRNGNLTASGDTSSSLWDTFPSFLILLVKMNIEFFCILKYCYEL